MSDLLIRFCFGGALVSLFSLVSDLFKPKSFAGLFGAAPSVALASLTLTLIKEGKETAGTNARSMILGALALLIYALCVGLLLVRFRMNPMAVSLSMLLLWIAAAVSLWLVVL